MNDAELIAKLSAGMKLKRSTMRSNWYGVLDNTRHWIDSMQIYRLIRDGKLVYHSSSKLTALLPMQLGSSKCVDKSDGEYA